MDNEQLKDINETIGKINDSSSSLGGNLTKLPTITSEALKDEAPIAITQPEVNTDVSGELAKFETQADDFTKGLETKTKQAKTQEADAFQKLIDGLVNTTGETEATVQAEKEAGLPEADTELRNINDQIRQEQNALRRQIEKVQTEAGLTKGQVNARVAELERQSYRKQADLAVIQQAAQGKYDSAKAIADRAVAVQMEQQRNYLTALQLNYERNQSLFSQAEQRAFESAQADRQRKLNQEEENRKNIYNLAITAGQNGAGNVTIQNILSKNDYREALSVASQFLVDPMERAIKSQQLQNAQLDNLIKRAEMGDEQALMKLNITPSDKVKLSLKEATTIQKEIINNDAFKSIQKSVDSITALKEYEKVFKEVGTTSGLTSPLDNEKLKTAYNTATLNLKEFFNLGVLNGPDLTIIQGVLGKPTEQGLPGPGNIIAGVGAKAGIENMKKQIEASIDDRYLSLRSQYGKYDSGQVGILNEIDRTYLQSKASVNDKVKQFLQDNPDLPIEDAIRVINTNL